MAAPRYAYAGPPRPRDLESWTEAITLSAGLHASLLLLALLLGTGEKAVKQVSLTEIRFLERPAAVKLPRPSSEESAVVKPGPKPAVEIVSGAAGPEGAGRAGLGGAGKAVEASSHPEMENTVPLSSPQGTKKGEVVTALPLSGPIVSRGEIGLVGRKKGSLQQLAGRTEGAPGSGSIPAPAGVVTASSGYGSTGTGAPIALSTEEISTIRKRESSLGVPLIGAPVVEQSVKKNIPQGSTLVAGSRALTRETLKANPLEKQEWGKKKGPFSMEGPLKYRKILSMELPPYPRWAEEKAIEATVSFRLWVDPKGIVKQNFYLERTSGYSELDGLARAALQKFRFIPLPSDQPQEDEWGVATFRFQLKR